MSKHIVVWDLETSGFTENPDARILEIGAIIVDIHTEEKVSEHQWVLNHGIEIPQVIQDLTGITPEIIEKEGQDPKTGLTQFLSILNTVINDGGLHVTHNGFRFDIPFLMKQMRHLDIPIEREWVDKLKGTGVDTAALYKGKKLGITPGDFENFAAFADHVLNIRRYGLKFSVSTACDDLGISREGIALHRALADVYLTNEIRKKTCSIQQSLGFSLSTVV